MNIYEIADGVRLLSVRTDRFKTSRITFTMATPLGGNVSAKAILPYLLHRRCRKYPDFTAFNCVLDDLYGAVVSAGVSKQGEGLLLNISITSIDDRFALEAAFGFDVHHSVGSAHTVERQGYRILEDGNRFNILHREVIHASFKSIH